MRRLIWGAVIFCAAWSIWWAVLAFGAHSAVSGWFAQQRAAGWQADYSALNMRGFPMRVRSDLRDVTLADTDAELVVALPRVSLGSPAYWPGDLRLDLPQDQILFTTLQGQSAAQFEAGQIHLNLHPNTGLELEQLTGASRAWALTGEGGTLFGADDLALSMIQDPDQAETYHLSGQATGFRPGARPRARLRIPDDWPVTFDRFEMRATVRFDRPWGLSAIEGPRPQPRAIKLALAEAAWSDLRLFFAADLEVDAAGVPSGTLNVQAENWKTMLDLAQGAGLLNAAAKEQGAAWLERLAAMSGDENALDIKLTLRGGYILFGFIPLGRAPNIRIR